MADKGEPSKTKGEMGTEGQKSSWPRIVSMQELRTPLANEALKLVKSSLHLCHEFKV